MPHGHAFRCGAAGDQRKYRLGERLRLQRRGKILFVIAADFADDQQSAGLRVRRVEGHQVGIAHALDRVAADADPHRGADAALREPETGLIGQRARFRHQAQRPGFQRHVRQETELGDFRHRHARRRTADPQHAGVLCQPFRFERIVHRHALGGRDDHPDAGGDGFLHRFQQVVRPDQGDADRRAGRSNR